MRIHVWNIKGYVYLNNDFLNYYEKKVLRVFFKVSRPHFGDFMRVSGLGSSQTARAVRNLIKEGDISKNENYYKIN